MKALSPIVAALFLGLAGCGSAPPAPVDRFYRLQDATLAIGAPRVAIRDVRAESLYAERPIVFTSADDTRQLRQYHYHLWLYPPARLVGDQLRAHFAPPAGMATPLAVEASVAAFERVLDGKSGLARAALDVSVSRGRERLLEKRYAAASAATDDSFSAFATAMETSLRTILGELQQDLARLEVAAR